MVVEAIEIDLVQALIVVWMDLIRGIVGIDDMEMVVEDMDVDMTIENNIDIVVDMFVEGKIVEEVGLHKHILANFVKVGFDFSEEAKLAMA